MYFKHIYEKGLAHASYMIGCQKSGTAMVIDPKRDVDTYIEIAAQEKLKITHITETHIHADFLSGSRELAALTGAELLLSNEGGAEWQYEFAHTGLRDGSSFMIGNIRVDVLHTPGHTPEHISFLVTDTPSSQHPIMIFTGDFVFVGDVGRPDLLERAAGYAGTMEQGARQMFNSLKRFKALPDHIQVWPGHGAGSACGKALGAIPGSTVGYEKLVNWALRINDEEKFIAELLSGQPEPPKYFAMMKKLNKTERRLVSEIPKPQKLSLAELKEAADGGTTIVDTRNKILYGQGHIPGSLCIQDNNAFSTWAGWILDYDKSFVLVAPEERIGELVRKLMRIGLDNIAGYVSGLEEWAAAGYELEGLEQMTVEELHRRISAGENIHVLDVRARSEWDSGHIEGAQHIHAGYVAGRLGEVPRDTMIAVQCGGGDRSSVAASVLLQNGFHNIANLAGGIGAWKKNNYPLVKEENVEA